jgi:colanic acid/amylovoran biosynthesis glycosyltransferase
MKVLMFNRAFFYVSETFIYKQVMGIPADIETDLLAFEITNENVFPSPNKKYKVKRTANTADRILTTIRKNIFQVRYKFSVFAHFAVKKILSRTRYDLVHAHFGFNGLLIYPLAKKLKIPLVVTFHGIDASPEMLSEKEYKKRIKRMIGYASAIIIVSPHMKETLSLSNHAAKVHLIPCGADPAEFDATRHPNQTGFITILHSGRLVSKKGVPDLIRIFSLLSHQYRNIRLFIVGDGPELELSRQLSDDARSDSIQFLGSRTPGEVKKFMADADIFVLNSRVGDNGDMEGVPVSLLEAMSMRLGVISTRHAGIPYVITDNVNGLLIDEKDNIALTSALEKLITDADLRKRLGESARQTVIDRFTTAQTNRKIEEVYRKVAANAY